jgi:hypothetical protein
MTSVSRTFTIPVVAPSSIPAWASSMVVGEIKTLSSGDSISSHQPTAVSNVGVCQDWTGGVYAPLLGAYGSFLQHGGGHSGYRYNEVYRFDMETAAWSRLTEPYLSTVVGPSGYWTDTTYYEYYASAGGALATGQVGASHTYARPHYAPPGSFGSDPKGYYVLPLAGTAPYDTPVPLGNGSTSYIHYIPLSAPVWTRWPTPFTGGGNSKSGSLYDSLRNAVVAFPQEIDGFSLSAYRTNLTSSISDTRSSSISHQEYYGFAWYDALYDRYCTTEPQRTPLTVHVTNASTGSAIRSTLTGAPSTPAGEWIESLRRLVIYPGSGNTVYWATCNGDPLTGSWTVSSVSMTGTAIARDTNAHYSRFRYVESLGLFFWLPSTSSQQAFKVW